MRGPRKCPRVDVGKVYASGHFKMRTQMYIICDVHEWTFSRATRGRRFPEGSRAWREARETWYNPFQPGKIAGF